MDIKGRACSANLIPNNFLYLNNVSHLKSESSLTQSVTVTVEYISKERTYFVNSFYKHAISICTIYH